MLDALLGGTSAMRKAKNRYLPRFPREDEASYSDRLGTATLFPAYERTVSILVGKPFSKPITYDETIPPRVAELLDDVDREGRNLHTFAASLAHDMLGYGFCGVLVDCPPSPTVLAGRKPSVADERQAGIRPYFVHVRGQQILGWRERQVGGKKVLTQLRILESVQEDDGLFGVKDVEQVRVLYPGAWEVWRKVRIEGRETWVVYDQGTSSLPLIPFVPFYGKRTGFMTGTAPMLELGHANVEHWQSKSDQQTILHVARMPLLFARGMGGADIVVSPHSIIEVDSEHAELKFVEHSGAAIEAGRMSLLDLEDRMRQAGAELLVIKPGDATTVQVHSENEQAKCDLQRMIEGLEDGLDQALDLMAQFLGLPEGGNVQVYKDFGAATLEEASGDMLHRMQQTGALSHNTLLSELKRRGTLAAEVDPDEEMVAASKEHTARQDADVERQAKLKKPAA